MSVVRPEQLTRVLKYMLDESEFLSPYGIRSVSRYHRDHPYAASARGQDFHLDYEPGESRTHLFGGNSNWRGPIWFPLNYLILESLKRYHMYFGDTFQVECPTGSGKMMNLHEVSRELARRLSRIFVPDAAGRRAVFGGYEPFQTRPALEGPRPLPRVLPRRHRRRPRREPPDGLDGARRQAPGRARLLAHSVP